jgi:hypothetical protein
MAKMRPQLLGQLRKNGHIPALPTLGFGDEDHLLLKQYLLALTLTNSETRAPV